MCSFRSFSWILFFSNLIYFVFYILDIILTLNVLRNHLWNNWTHRKLTKQFLKQKSSSKPKVAGFGVASAVLVFDLCSIKLGHERVR
jgi:hypothetical protein